MKDKIINIAGVACICGGYRIAKYVLKPVYEESGTISKIGMNIISGYVGLVVSGLIVKAANRIQKSIDEINANKEKEEENGGN